MSRAGTESAQTRASIRGIVDREGGGCVPTLDWVEVAGDTAERDER